MKKISIRVWISVATFVLIGVILVFSRKDLARAWHLIGQLDWWILVLIVPTVLLGYLATGEMIFSYLRFKKLIKHVSLWAQVRISLELNFVNHVLPSGGLSGVSYMNWRLGKYGVSVGRATMAQAVRYAMGFASVIVLLAISVLLVTMDGTVNRWLILMSTALVVCMVSAVVFVMYLMSNTKRISNFSHGAARFANKLVKKVTFGHVKTLVVANKVEVFLVDLTNDYASLMRDKRAMLQPFLWGFVSMLADVAVFWIVFWALGSPVNPAPILIGFGIASIAGFFVVTPGGAGAYEAVMVIVLGIAGTAQSEAIAGVVLSRVIILLVTIVGGYILYQQVVMKYGKRPNSEI